MIPDLYSKLEPRSIKIIFVESIPDFPKILKIFAKRLKTCGFETLKAGFD